MELKRKYCILRIMKYDMIFSSSNVYKILDKKQNIQDRKRECKPRTNEVNLRVIK